MLKSGCTSEGGTRFVFHLFSTDQYKLPTAEVRNPGTKGQHGQIFCIIM